MKQIFKSLLVSVAILTVAMFPLLVIMYGRLAITEEREVERAFGAAYRRYAEATPRWVPRLRRAVEAQGGA